MEIETFPYIQFPPCPCQTKDIPTFLWWAIIALVCYLMGAEGEGSLDLKNLPISLV